MVGYNADTTKALVYAANAAAISAAPGTCISCGVRMGVGNLRTGCFFGLAKRESAVSKPSARAYLANGTAKAAVGPRSLVTD